MLLTNPRPRCGYIYQSFQLFKPFLRCHWFFSRALFGSRAPALRYSSSDSVPASGSAVSVTSISMGFAYSFMASSMTYSMCSTNGPDLLGLPSTNAITSSDHASNSVFRLADRATVRATSS